MKIILLEDIKKKGKKGDILNVKDGYGTYLINDSKAIVASTENLRNLDRSNERKKIKEEELIKECDGIEGVQECFGLDEYIDDIKEQLYYDSDSDDGDYYYVDLMTFSVGKITVKTEKTVRVSDLIW